MYIVKIQGGIGNQMFQYAFIKLLENRFPQKEIVADLSNYALNNPHSGYQLEQVFGIDVHQIRSVTLSKILDVYVPKRHKFIPAALDRQLNKVIYSIKNKKRTPNNMLVQQYNSGYPALDLSLFDRDNIYLNGTWMSEDYSKILNNLREIFSLDKLSCEYSEMMKQRILRDNDTAITVSIHIRGGDYVGTELQVVDESYYKEAVMQVMEETTNVVFYLFTDEAELSSKYRNLIEGMGVESDRIVQVMSTAQKKDIDDMFLMSYCRYNIIANSTFSYWSALLNKNCNNKVFYPSLYAKGKDFWDISWVPFAHLKINI